MSTLITNKHGKVIPEPFQAWAQLRRDQCTFFKEIRSYDLFESFDWWETPEGHAFWLRVDTGKPTEPHPSWGPQAPQEPLTMEDVFVGLK